MKRVFMALLVLFLLFGCSKDSGEDVGVYFCPEDNCSARIISAIGSAEESIDLAMYSFTLDSVAEALAGAERKGVRVRVLLDYTQSANEFSVDEALEDAGVDVYRKNGYGLMHNKFMVIDSGLVVTGSFNYSRSGDTKNDENLVFIYNENAAEEYSREFAELVFESEYYG